MEIVMDRKQMYIEAAKKRLHGNENLRDKMRGCKFDTIAVHGLYSMKEALDFNQGSIVEPIYLTTSQVYRDADEMELALEYKIPSWIYTRISNPNTYYLEAVLSLLEEYKSGVTASCYVTSSGMSAIRTVIDEFLHYDRKVDGKPFNFVAPSQIYGGTYQLFSERKVKESNIEWRKVAEASNIQEWESLIDENTRFLYGEIPSNPVLSFFDIEKVARLAHSHGVPLIIDSTVATPALLRPLALGADIVVHSATKALTSSGFGTSGAIVARHNISAKSDNEEMKRDFCNYLKRLPGRDYGANLSPLQAVLTINDIRTLRMKIDVMSKNAMKVSQYLESHRNIEKVHYLGLENHKYHDIAKRFMFLVDSEFDDQYRKPINRYGYLLSFEVVGGWKNARTVFDNLSMIWRAADLGKVKSVATLPTISTHSQQGKDARMKGAIPDNLIRLSVGTEHADDIISDLERALAVLD